MVNIDTTEIDFLKNDWFLIVDIVDFLIGKNLGNGETRKVYDCSFDPNNVVKIEIPNRDDFQFDNVAEFQLWINLRTRFPEYAKFLAPCIRLSCASRILIQKKTTPIDKKELPKSIPYFLADTHINNWGRIGKFVVCHDYANHSFYAKIPRKKFYKPSWRV